MCTGECLAVLRPAFPAVTQKVWWCIVTSVQRSHTFTQTFQNSVKIWIAPHEEIVLASQHKNSKKINKYE